MLYFDYASSVPVYSEIIDMIDFKRWFGNSAAIHTQGQEMKSLLEKSRRKIAEFFHFNAENVIFTSGATEANNLLIHGIAKHIDLFLIDETSHPASREPCKLYNHVMLKVNQNGNLNEDFLNEQIAQNHDKSICIIITPVNHMTGVKQNIKIHKSDNIYIHADCAQSVHKISDYSEYDSVTISGHKIGAPIGIGALLIRDRIKDLPLSPIINGSAMENGYRSGTVNHIFAYLLSEVLSIPYSHPNHDLFEQTVLKYGGQILGYDNERSKSISCVSMPNILNIVQVEQFSKYNIQVSTGSACSSNEYIFNAMNQSHLSQFSIRISSGRYNTQSDIESLSKAWTAIYLENTI